MREGSTVAKKKTPGILRISPSPRKIRKEEGGGAAEGVVVSQF